MKILNEDEERRRSGTPMPWRAFQSAVLSTESKAALRSTQAMDNYCERHLFLLD